MIDAEAGKLLFGKQKRNSMSSRNRGRSGVRRGAVVVTIRNRIKLLLVDGDGNVTNGPVIRDKHNA